MVLSWSDARAAITSVQVAFDYRPFANTVKRVAHVDRDLPYGLPKFPETQFPETRKMLHAATTESEMHDYRVCGV